MTDWRMLYGLLLGGIGIGFAVSLVPPGWEWVGLTALGTILLLLTWKWPPLALSVFLFSSSLKAGLAIPGDLTLITGGLLMVRVVAFVAEFGWQPIPRSLWAWVAFAALLSVGALGSPAPVYGLDKVLRFVLLSGLTVVAAIQLLRDARSLLGFAWANVLLSAVISMGAVIVGGDPRFYGRLAAFGADTIALGRASALGLTTMYVLGWWRKAPWFIVAAGVGLYLWALLGSGNRASLLAVTLSIVVAIVMGIRNDRGGRWRAVLMSAAVIGSGVMLWQVVPIISAARYGGLLEGFGAFYGDERFLLMGQALSLWVRHPLMGAGTGAFASVSSTALYPHNLLAEVLSENGILGLILLLWPVVASFVRVSRAPLRPTISGQILVTGIVTSFVGALLSSDLNGQRALYAFVAAALAMGPVDHQPEASCRSREWGG